VRDIIGVMDAVVKLIPPEFVGRSDLLVRIESIKSSVPYTAPEIMIMRWDQLESSLQHYLGIPDAEWKHRIRDVMIAKIDYRSI